MRGLLAALAADPVALVLIAPLEGLGFASVFVGGVTVLAAHAPAGLQGTAQGLFAACAGLATIIGSFGGGAIAGALGIPGLFLVGAVVSLVGTGIMGRAPGCPARCRTGSPRRTGTDPGRRGVDGATTPATEKVDDPPTARRVACLIRFLVLVGTTASLAKGGPMSPWRPCRLIPTASDDQRPLASNAGDDGGRSRFNAEGVFVRFIPAAGEPFEALGRQGPPGHYVATVTVPAGGIAQRRLRHARRVVLRVARASGPT